MGRTCPKERAPCRAPTRGGGSGPRGSRAMGGRASLPSTLTPPPSSVPGAAVAGKFHVGSNGQPRRGHLPPPPLLRQYDTPRPVRSAAAQVFPTPKAAADSAASTRRQPVAPTCCQRARRGRRQDRGVAAHHDRREGQPFWGRRRRPSQWSMLAVAGGHVVPRRRGVRRSDAVRVARHGPAARAAATADVAAAATPAPFGGQMDTDTTSRCSQRRAHARGGGFLAALGGDGGGGGRLGGGRARDDPNPLVEPCFGLISCPEHECGRRAKAAVSKQCRDHWRGSDGE